jgi:hypothetical protein
VLTDFIEEHQAPERPVANYEDWLLARLRADLRRALPMTYCTQMPTTTAANMSTDWLGPECTRPNLEEVLRGAVSSSAPHVHYITHFRYATDGDSSRI